MVRQKFDSWPDTMAEVSPSSTTNNQSYRLTYLDYSIEKPISVLDDETISSVQMAGLNTYGEVPESDNQISRFDFVEELGGDGSFQTMVVLRHDEDGILNIGFSKDRIDDEKFETTIVKVLTGRSSQIKFLGET